MILKISHISDSSNKQSSIDFDSKDLIINKGSQIISLSDDIVFDENAIVWNGLIPSIQLQPVLNVRVLHGYIRIFDAVCLNKYVDVEIFCNQYNGLWVEEGEFIDRIGYIKDDCSVLSSEGNTIEGIKFTTDSWVKSIKVFGYKLNHLKLKVSGNLIFFVDYPSKELYETPIFLCGYDIHGNMIAEVTFYLTYLLDFFKEETKHT